MTRTELKARADAYRTEAAKAATTSDRDVLLKKARNYYADAGYAGLAAWCDRFLG